MQVNEWYDVYYGIEWPAEKPLVKALGRPLRTPIGNQEHVVACCWSHGRPLLGRAWQNASGKLMASFTQLVFTFLNLFSRNGREFTGESVGSLQVLVKLPAIVAGFDYVWIPYEQASKYLGKDYAPVQWSGVAPCVLLTKENYEVLGQVDLNKERAEAAIHGEIVVKNGPGDLNHLMVLCRRDRHDTYMI